MPEKKSKDITPQEDAVAKIEHLNFKSVDHLEAFTEGDDRKKVEAAIEAKKAEIESSNESTDDDKETAADSEDDDTEDAETIKVATVGVEKDSIAALFEAVHRKVVYEKERRGRAEAQGVDAKLEDACDELEDLFNADGDPVEVEEQKLVDIATAVAQKVNKDQERRGMNQPSDMDRALIDANKALDKIA